MSSNNRKLRSFKRLKGITTISLFDGMSCGQIALNRIGFNIENYYASEVDKYAMQVTQHNYPNTIQIGSVLDITIERLSNFEILLNDKYILDTREVILIGGSPCQGFSFAGTMAGSSTTCNIDVTTLEQYLDLKSKKFKFKGQSYLFWEYVRVLQELKPMYYFLENVKMVKKWKNMFNEAIGCEPIIINSALVSAQNRVRLYWTNIPEIEQPDDKGVVIADVLEDEVDEKYYMSQKATLRALFHKRSRAFTSDKKKTGALLANQAKQGTDGLYHIADIDIKGHDILKRVYSKEGKSPTLNTCSGGNREVKIIDEDEKFYRKYIRLINHKTRNKILVVSEATKKGYIVVKDGDCFDYTHPNSTTRRGRDMKTKCNCLTTSHQYMRFEYPRVRKLTPLECERLQTVPDNYTSIVSNSQRYKMLGNGWTVDVPAHIFTSLLPHT